MFELYQSFYPNDFEACKLVLSEILDKKKRLN